jgi:hypothetical protein
MGLAIDHVVFLFEILKLDWLDFLSTILEKVGVLEQSD